jgi:tripartite-type tricarboxylate transporter receptor subunit TctC
LILNSAIGIKPTLVPFTGTSPAWTALLAGQVDYICDPILGPLPHVRAGTVKALAIAAPQRHPLMPDVPTAAEQGLPQFDVQPFYGIFAPKGTPQPILAKLTAALNKGLDDPVVRKRLEGLGATITPPDQRGPKGLAAVVHSEVARLTPILKAASMK